MPLYALSAASIILCLPHSFIENPPIHMRNLNGTKSVFVARGESTKAPSPSPVTLQVIVVLLVKPYCSPWVQTWLVGYYCRSCLRNGPRFLFTVGASAWNKTTVDAWSEHNIMKKMQYPVCKCILYRRAITREHVIWWNFYQVSM